jgi:hypothetical protein
MESGVTGLGASPFRARSCALKGDEALCWGGSLLRRAAEPPAVVAGLESGVNAVSAGVNHACAIKDGEAWCWGVNADGQLGDGTTNDSPTVPVRVAWTAGGAPTPAATAAAAPTSPPAAGPTQSSPPSVPSTPAPPVSSGNDEDALWAAIRAVSPGVQFQTSCQGFAFSAANPTCHLAGGWTPQQLASGIAETGTQGPEAGSLAYFARKADGTWALYASIGNGGGGPLAKLPGDGLVCADGDGLNLRAEPSTTAAVVTLLPDTTTVRVDRFVLAEATIPGRAQPGSIPHGNGWYHVTSPQEGWAFSDFLVPATDGGCGRNWWP